MDIAQQAIALVLVFAMLWAVLWFLRRRGWTSIRGSRATPGLLQARGKLTLTARHSIHLVQMGNRTVAIAVHPEGVTLLGDIEAGEAGEQQQRLK